MLLMIGKKDNKVLRPVMALMLWLPMLALTGISQAAPSDHDGDGISDPTLIAIESDQSLSWQALDSASQKSQDLGSLGFAGDHIVMARWTGAVTPELAVVSETNKGLLWEISGSSGAQSFVHGNAGDLVVAGSDFNGNGIADAAVVKRSRGAAEWKVLLDPGIGGTQVLTANFGRWRDKAFAANINGSGDLAGVFTRRKSGRPSLRFLDFNGLSSSSVVRLPAKVGRSGNVRPEPISNPQGLDDLVLVDKRGRKVAVYVYSTTGQKIYSMRTRVAGDVVIGNYTAEAGEEIAFQNGTVLTVVNPYSGTVSELVIPQGILVDEINVKLMGKSSQPSKNQDKAPSSCKRVSSFPGSHIYKTIGSTHFSPVDVRRNTIGLIVKPGGSGPFPSCAYALDSENNVVAKLGLYQRGGSWAARYYAGVGCGSDTAYNGSRVGQNARENTGSTNIYLQFDSVCYGPIDATRCVGSSQC